MPRNKGWERESARHSLASRGVKTKAQKLASARRARTKEIYKDWNSKWRYVYVWSEDKAGEGGMGYNGFFILEETAKDKKTFKVEKTHSPYVGQVGIKFTSITKDGIEDAFDAMIEAGYWSDKKYESPYTREEYARIMR